MNTSNPIRQWGLLLTRGLLYLIIGGTLFLFARSFSSQTAKIIGGLFIAAGLCGVIYTRTNLRTDRNNLWELLRSLFDIVFGIVFLIYSTGELQQFLEIMGFWAILYGFIEAIQTMYSFMLSGVRTTATYFPIFFHFASVLMAGALAYMVILTPSSIHNLSALVGLFPIILGVLIIAVAFQHRREAQLSGQPM